MNNCTREDFKFIHSYVSEELNNSKLFKRKKIEAIPTLGTFVGQLIFAIANIKDVDDWILEIQSNKKKWRSYRDTVKGVSFSRCNNYLGKNFCDFLIEREHYFLGQKEYSIVSQVGKRMFRYLDDHFFIRTWSKYSFTDSYKNDYYVDQIPLNFSDKILNFISFLDSKKNKRLKTKDHCELFRISNFVEESVINDVKSECEKSYEKWLYSEPTLKREYERRAQGWFDGRNKFSFNRMIHFNAEPDLFKQFDKEKWL